MSQADDITEARLSRPSLMLKPLENKKSNAQYLFADRSCHFLLDTIGKRGYRKVLCVGTPRLHELIKLRNQEGKGDPMKSLLLDVDFSSFRMGDSGSIAQGLKCVKPSWRHCQSCGRCALRDHPCGNSPGLEGCFNCGSLKHKRRACHLKDKQRTSNNKTKGGRILPKQQPKKSNSKRKSGAQRRANKLKETAE
uniref:Uncharacterized protein n=1 Tax=Hucho hucho TaxID=62062 RepID=A0A4W5QQL8_9TELE